MKEITKEIKDYLLSVGYPILFKRKIYYLEVWLWLWREKENPIYIDYSFCNIDENIKDPEEAINAAIDYLIENKKY